MFNNLKLAVKLNGSFIAVAMLTLILGALAISSMRKAETTASVLSEQRMREVVLANEIANLLAENHARFPHVFTDR